VSGITVNIPNVGPVVLSPNNDGTLGGTATLNLSQGSVAVGIAYNPTSNALVFSANSQLGYSHILNFLLNTQASITSTNNEVQVTTACQVEAVVAGGLVQGSESCAGAIMQVVGLSQGGLPAIFSPSNIRQNEFNNTGDPSASDNINNQLEDLQSAVPYSSLSAPATATLVNYTLTGSNTAPTATEFGTAGANLSSSDLSLVNGGNLSDSALIGGGTGAMLAGGNGPVVILALNSGSSVSAGASTNVYIENDGISDTNTGPDDSVYVDCYLDTINQSLGAITMASGGSANVSGNDNSVVLNGGDAVGVSGGGNYVTNGPLEIAAYVTNDDIEFVSPGQKAEVKIDSFPFSRFGTIGATVTSVAHDAIPADAADHALTDAARHDDADSHTLAPGAKPMSDLVFATRLKLDASVIGIGYQANPLAAGMTTSVEIKTGQRRIIGYLFSPLIEAAANAMKER
jgi:hypothetical protein